MINFSYLGFFIIGILVLSWFVSTAIYRRSHLEDRMPATWQMRGSRDQEG